MEHLYLLQLLDYVSSLGVLWKYHTKIVKCYIYENILLIYVIGIFFAFTGKIFAQDPGKINPIMDSIQPIKFDSKKAKKVDIPNKLFRPFKKKRDQKEQERIVALLEMYLKDVRNEIREKINDINSIDFQYDTTYSKKVFKVNDSTLFSLQTEMRVFGWQDANLNPNVIQNYNFNYLTDIIYHGYELGPDGKAKNEKMLNNLLIDSTLATLVQKNRIKLSLSIFSKTATDISTFLSSKNAVETLISNIKAMQEEVPIEGINIYFENFSKEQKQNFTEFISRVRKSLQSQKEFRESLTKLVQ